MANLGNRDDVRAVFLSQEDASPAAPLAPQPANRFFVEVDCYLLAARQRPNFSWLSAETVRFQGIKNSMPGMRSQKLTDQKPDHVIGFQARENHPTSVLINQAIHVLATSTPGGCRALCTRPGHPCVGCRGPSDAFIEKESAVWLESIQRVFEKMTNVPPEEIQRTLRSPQLSLFLFQFSDYDQTGKTPRPKEKVL